ncbi:MAG: GH25 family lysozyme [Polyangiaceae bacterium]
MTFLKSFATTGRAALAVGAAALFFGCTATPADEDLGEDTGETDSGVKVCASGATVKGVDVSFYQGNVTWSKVKAAGYKFAFARVSDGVNYPDDKFQQNWAGLKQQGMIRGAYQFFRPGQNATTQANMMVQAVGVLGDGDLPAVIDVETADGQSSATIVSKIHTWISVVEKGTGKKPLIYAASGFWDTLSGTGQLDAYDLWVANYGVSCPYLPNTWDTWKFWQYTDSGSIPGIAGGVDTNYFNGTFEQLAAYAKATTQKSPMGVAWTRKADGSYVFSTESAPAAVDHVSYEVDTYPIGGAAKDAGATFPVTYSFSLEKAERKLVVKGFDDKDNEVARAIALLDVTADTGVFIRQTGAKEYEIGLERAPAAVATISVTADNYALVDGVTGKTKSPRLAVKTTFNTLGARKFAITTYNADGSKRGTLYRTFTLE